MQGKANAFGIILAGGNGTRLWPLSRRELPKQFLAIEGGKSLLQGTALRLMELLPKENIRVVAGNELASIVLWQLGQIGFDGSFLIDEPEGKNTAPAIALAIAALLDEGASPEDAAIVCPSDHIIKDSGSFKKAAQAALEQALKGNLVTLGIAPDRAETGFGYIKTAEGGGPLALRAIGFEEKPNKETAERYVKEGGYYWNAGIFCFRLKDMAAALEQYFPECGSLIKEGSEKLKAAFGFLPSKSIDYAVMERAKNIACVPMDAGWSDAGSWDSVFDALEKDGAGNVLLGDVQASRVANSLLLSRDRLLCASDIEGIIAVDTPDALFITSRGSSQNVRAIVERLKGLEKKEEWQACENVRPWGSYRILSETATDKIKRIRVSPRSRISLQCHNFRSEHWVVVSGEATVTLIDGGDRKKRKLVKLKTGESCFVPAKMLHRLENCTDEPLEIIEVQTGSYLGEDDIARIDDDFNRA